MVVSDVNDQCIFAIHGVLWVITINCLFKLCDKEKVLFPNKLYTLRHIDHSKLMLGTLDSVAKYLCLSCLEPSLFTHVAKTVHSLTRYVAVAFAFAPPLPSLESMESTNRHGFSQPPWRHRFPKHLTPWRGFVLALLAWGLDLSKVVSDSIHKNYMKPSKEGHIDLRCACW